MTDEQIRQKIDNLDARLKTLETREQHITDSIKQNTKVLQKIERALLGESISGSKGLVKRMDITEDNVEDLQEWKRKWIYWLSGAAFIGSSLAGILWIVVENFILKQ